MDVRLVEFSEALDSFDYLVHVDLEELVEQLDERIIDGLRNGIAQKFEYATELCWKAIKVFLKAQNGIDESSPKKVVKAFYLEGYVEEDDFLKLIQAIEDRNRLRHIYDEEHFCQILSRLTGYVSVYKRVRETLIIAADE